MNNIDLSSIDVASLDADTLSLLDELVAIESKNPSAVYWSGGMSPIQAKFHQDKQWNRLLRAGNKIGKTRALSEECWGFLAGTHLYNDYWKVPSPCIVLYVVADLEVSYGDDVCATLRECEPPGCLHHDCSYDTIKGYMVRGKRGILLANGSKVIFRSGKQDGMSLEGIWSHVVIINEPPKQNKWGGIMRAAANANAPILMGFTPIGEDLSWLRKVVEEDRDTAELWGQTIAILCPENVPHKPEEFILKQIANVASWERAQRIYAEWEGTNEDRAYEGFCDENVSDDAPEIADAVVLGIDHGERVGHQAAIVAYVWNDPVDGTPCAYITDEYVSPGRTSPNTDAIHIDKMLQKHGITLYDISEAVGDVNSAGKSAAGESINSMMESAFASICHSYQPPFRISKVGKRPGSVLGNQKVINAALIDGRIKIHSRCKELIKCFKQWKGTKTGKDENYTHLLDAMRYVLADRLDPSRNRPADKILVR